MTPLQVSSLLFLFTFISKASCSSEIHNDESLENINNDAPKTYINDSFEVFNNAASHNDDSTSNSEYTFTLAGTKRKASEDVESLAKASEKFYENDASPPSSASSTAATAADAAGTGSVSGSFVVSPDELLSVKEVAERFSSLTLDEIRGYLVALGDSVKDPIKENCGWNLLHEAVFNDDFALVPLLITEFAFDPNEFDPFFGSAVFLVQSRRMAEMLRNYGANLNDMRSCSRYRSAVHSAYARGKLGLVSLVEPLNIRTRFLSDALIRSQSTLARTAFKAKRAQMFDVALGVISRRRGTSGAAVEISFMDEEGQDAGGLTVEFINFIKDTIISRSRILKQHDKSGYFYLIPDEEFGDDHTNLDATSKVTEIKLLGYIVGLSLFHNVPLKIVFSPLIYQIITGFDPLREVDMLAVLRETDEEFYSNLIKMSLVPEKDIDAFSYPEVKGDHLRPWKRQQGALVSKLDIKQYILLEARNHIYLPYRNVLRHFKAGIESAIDPRQVKLHVIPEEVQELIIGEVDYKAADWRAACMPPTHPSKYNEQYEWFWRAIDEYTPAERASVLKFVTALIALPTGGFGALSHKPTVLFIDEPEKTDRLPKSSTCFNQIRLYPISSYDKMKDVVIKAAEYGNMGFGDR